MLSADTVSEMLQPPERCLSRQAEIVRCCPYFVIINSPFLPREN